MRLFQFSYVLLCIFSLGLIVQNAYGHGSMETPVSRIYNCFLENPENPKSDACKAAVQEGGTQALYDWNGVNQGSANDMHREIIPDGKLCSGGNELFKGMDLARGDWPSTMIAPDANGRFEFVFIASAPHSTDYFRFYVTKDGYNPLSPLKWSDLEEPPFCTINDVVLENGRYKMDCPLPQNKTGKHVVYSIWQRDDSQEAFYTCMDVEFMGGAPVVWRSIGQVRAQQDLKVGDSVTFRLFDSETGGDLETHTVILQNGQSAADQWPFYLAEHVNVQSSIAKIGILDEDGNINPVLSSQENNVYVSTEGEFSFQIDIEASDNPPNEGLTTDVTTTSDWGAGYCADVTVTNIGEVQSDWTVTIEIDGTIREVWNATYSQDGDQLTADGLEWNNVVDPGQSVGFGFCADRDSNPPPPTPGPTPEPTQAPTFECSDGVDNDNDGLVDFPNDPGCDSATDDDEFNETTGGEVSTNVNINDDWGRGYCAEVDVVNNSSSPVDWEVSFDIEGTVRNLWSATYQQDGSTVNAEGVSWNNVLSPGQSTRFGFCALR